MTHSVLKFTCDAVVIGGGPGGSASALALRQSGVERVLLLEASGYDQPRIGESIPPDTRVLFRELDLLEHFPQDQHLPCRGSCSIWAHPEPGYNDFLFNPHGHGWHLDRVNFDRWLAEQVTERGGEVWTQSRWKRQKTLENGFELEVEWNGQMHQIRTRFVIDATGPAQQFSKQMGARRQFHDRLIFAAATFQLREAASLSELTHLEAVASGWWYAGKLPQGRALAAFATDPEVLKSEGLNEVEVWKNDLRRSRLVGPALAQATLEPESFRIWVAHSFLSDRVTGPHWAAVGDAASAYDPISSQGIYKALASGITAGRAAAQILRHSDPSGLQAYSQQVQAGFGGYLRSRNQYYDQERRFGDEGFWGRRRARRAIVAVVAPEGAPGASTVARQPR